MNNRDTTFEIHGIDLMVLELKQNYAVTAKYSVTFD
jgi:hypothetical protein